MIPDLPKLPLGDWVEVFVGWLRTNVRFIFDIISEIFDWLISNFEDLLDLAPPLVLALIFGIIAWRARSLVFGLFTAVAFALIESMEMWTSAMSTLALVVIATVVAVAIGIPVGIAAARTDIAAAIVRPVLDFMQTMPAFVYLIPAVFFFGLGKVPGLVATIVFSMPPAVRLTNLGIRQVDPEVVEAGAAFGAGPWRILRKIQFPLALPTIMAGVNQVIMLALSMVVIAGMAGAGGLGALVFRSITRVNIGLGFESGIAVVILAMFLDRLTGALGERTQARAGG